MNFGFDFGDDCALEKGKRVDSWETGDCECNAVSTEYECGGVYHHNYGDIVGCRDHDCFWDCSKCKYHKIKEELNNENNKNRN